MRFRSLRPNRGFTLIEVLIAVIVFGVGLLTVASLQGVARKSNYEAVQRTTAVHLAEALLEQMRANRRSLDVYVGGGGNREFSIDSPPPAGPDCSSVVGGIGCPSWEMAAADLAEWWNQVIGATALNPDDENVGGLVQPTACISGRGDGASGRYEVAIAWRGSSDLQLDSQVHDCGDGSFSPDGFRRVVAVWTFLNTL